jgi:hypothetical protein
MKYGEAFGKLGYQLSVPRQDWTSERDDGICTTLWKSGIDTKNWYYDSREHGDKGEDCQSKSGNKKRIRHATRAINEFGGWVDVVLVDGVSGEGVDNAEPWFPKDRKGKRWRVTFLDQETGHIRLDLGNG